MIVLGIPLPVPTKSTSAANKQEPTVIQQEGWLWKRGAGFRNGVPVEGSMYASANSSAEEDVPVSRRGSVHRMATTPSTMTSFFFGKDERKRYFLLLTTQAGGGRQAGKEGPKAELRYFKTRPETTSDRANPKGSIILTADMDVSAEDNVILIFSPGRTYYLRQDVPEAQSAKAKTLTSQWINAIRFALSGLRAYELQGAVGAGVQPHPLQDHRSFRITGLISGLNEERLAARKSFSGPKLLDGISEDNADGLAMDFCPFADLWHVEGIEAYDRVVAHFGPALTDLNRLMDHFEARVLQIDHELGILDNELGHASDVIVKEQKSIGEVMRELHRTSQRHASALREASKDFKSRVIEPIDETIKDIGMKLENIVTKHSHAAKYVEGAKKALVEAMDKVEKLQEMLDLALNVQMNGEPQRQRLRRKSEGPPADPVKLENDLNEARQARRDASQTLVTTETKHAETISRAMDELYKLERLRLEKLYSFMEAASDVEQRLAQKLSSEAGALETSLENIDPSRDIRSTFARLKASAEKKRGKVRRKNSLYNRVDFTKLVVDDD